MTNLNEFIYIGVPYDSMVHYMHLMSILTVSHVRMFICCVRIDFVKGIRKMVSTSKYRQCVILNVSIIYTMRHFEQSFVFGFCFGWCWNRFQRERETLIRFE